MLARYQGKAGRGRVRPSTRRGKAAYASAMRAVLTLALSGCSLSLDLEGPPAYIVPTEPDLATLEAGIQDGLVPVGVDAGLDASLPTSVEVVAPPGARLVRHPGGAGAVALPEVPASGRATFEAEPGDAVTVVITEAMDGREQAWLVTVAGIEPGDVLPISHPAPALQRMTSLRLRLDTPRDDAAGYVVSNGCVELRCEGMSCTPWFEGRERSIAVTDRCIAEERVRSVSVALDADGRRVAWAEAENEVPAEDGGSQTTFSEWREAWREVRVALTTRAEQVSMFARPFDGVAFGTGPAHRWPVEDGEVQATIRVPDGFARQVEVGADLLNPGVEAARDRPARAWRRLFDSVPDEVVVADAEVPGLPVQVTLQVDAEGSSPGILWLAEASGQDLARVELQWEAGGQLVTWIGFQASGTGSARVPELPDGLGDLRPAPGTEGTYAQLTLVRCDGNGGLRDHRVRPCPIYGAGGTSPVGRTVAWSSALAQLPPPPPDAAVPDAAPADAGMP